MIPGVKKSTPIGLAGLFSICVALLGCASGSNVVSLGRNTYSVTRTATTAFSRNPEKLAAQAREEATKFCDSQGKVMKVVSVTAGQPYWGGGMSSAKIVFMALKSGDPALNSEPAPTSEPAPVASAERAAPASSDLYAELTKLNELRQKGILTEDELQAQKKKILARSD